MKNTNRVKLACYSMNVAMAVVGNLPPLLFITFHNTYGFSYSLLGLLVLINFSTQLGVDLIFTFFSHKFNIQKTVKTAPLLTILGFVIFAVWPSLFASSAYLGLVIGTVVFSASSGLAEVLLNPIIAALPSDNTESDLSKLHSAYAWGAVSVIVFSSLFLLIFGAHNWQWLIMIMLLVPLVSFVLYRSSKLPDVQESKGKGSVVGIFKTPAMWLGVLLICLGGALECIMAQWCSGFCEVAIGIPKIWGDIFGAALFAIMLGLGRTLYAKYGKRIERVLILGVCGAFICYIVAVFSPSPIIGLIACALTGFATSMLWPGNIIAVSERIPNGGVLMYAMMAAGGDLGASLGPELVGVVTDAVSSNSNFAYYASQMGFSIDQMGMKCGLLIGALVAFISIPIYLAVYKKRNNT